jgi:hypothetical protein
VNAAFFCAFRRRFFLTYLAEKHKGIPYNVNDSCPYHDGEFLCRRPSVIRRGFKHPAFDKIAAAKCVFRIRSDSFIHAVLADIQNRVKGCGT